MPRLIKCAFKDVKIGELYFEETSDFSATLKVKASCFSPADETLANQQVVKLCFDKEEIVEEKSRKEKLAKK